MLFLRPLQCGIFVFKKLNWHARVSGKSRVGSLEVESLERELRLDDSGGLDPGPQHVLLRRCVVRGGDAVQAGRDKNTC